MVRGRWLPWLHETQQVGYASVWKTSSSSSPMNAPRPHKNTGAALGATIAQTVSVGGQIVWMHLLCFGFMRRNHVQNVFPRPDDMLPHSTRSQPRGLAAQCSLGIAEDLEGCGGLQAKRWGGRAFNWGRGSKEPRG